MKLGDSAQKPVILPTVSEKEAAHQFVDILKEHQVDILVFHDEDQRIIRPLRLTMHNSRKFFELMQEGKAVLGQVVRVKLELMVKDYGKDAVFSSYKDKKNSALTDSLVLKQLLEGDFLEGAWREWLGSRLVGE